MSMKQVFGPVSVEIEGELARVIIDNPPVNATSQAVRQGLWDAVNCVDQSSVNLALLSCAGRTFVAGGDITEFSAPPAEPHLNDVTRAIEEARVPWAALMHGSVFGGGLELALACRYRFALENTRFALPEVTLGLVPGAGGTQRLPRIAGVPFATEMVTTGAPVDAMRLKNAGVLDGFITDLHDDPRLWIETHGARSASLPVHASDPGPGWFEDQREVVKRRAKGAEAPLLNLDAIELSVNDTLETGLAKERALHLNLRQSAQSKALRYAFFAERNTHKLPELKIAVPRALASICVVGGGLMGAGIAVACLLKGYPVVLLERDDAACQAAHDRIADILTESVKRGKISEDAMVETLGKLTTSPDYSQCARCDLAVEAVFEDLEVKRQVVEQLAVHMAPEAIIATNTSYLDPRKIFESVPGQDRCIGLHFFSPAHIMKLVEVVPMSVTTMDVTATGFALVKALGKTGVFSGICEGFIGNRMLAAIRRAADGVLAEGATPAEVDRAMRAYGMPMGPYELQDRTGLDIAWGNRKRARAQNPDIGYIPIADTLCEAGRFGRKSGAGWYDYPDPKSGPVESDFVRDTILEYIRENGSARQDFSPEDIQEKLTGALVQEGQAILDEGVARNASDIDVVQLLGYGFPRWRGGPMHAGQTRQ